MKFSTTTYFVIAFVMTFATNFGMADVVPDLNPRSLLRGLDAVPADATPSEKGSIDTSELLRQLEIDALEEFDQEMDAVDAKQGDRALVPGIMCYKVYCLGIARGFCHIWYPKCFPL